MSEPPKITILGTFSTSPGEVLAISAGMDVDAAAEAILEASFVQHQEAERLAHEAEAAAEEREFQAEVERQRIARLERELFWMPDLTKKADEK
jgi:hypothetical protein